MNQHDAARFKEAFEALLLKKMTVAEKIAALIGGVYPEWVYDILDKLTGPEQEVAAEMLGLERVTPDLVALLMKRQQKPPPPKKDGPPPMQVLSYADLPKTYMPFTEFANTYYAEGTEKHMAKAAPPAAPNSAYNRKADDDIAGQAPPDYVAEVNVDRSGERIVIPETMTIGDAIIALKRRAEEEEQTVDFYEPVDTYPMDGVHALMLVLKERFGWASLAPTPGFFGPTPPAMISVEVSATNTTQVPWGTFKIPGIDGSIQSDFEIRDDQVRFVMTGSIKRKHERLAKEIADATRRKVKTHSLYRGKAIRIVFPDLLNRNFNPVLHVPRFIDTRSVNEAELILPRDTEAILQAALWTPIVASQMCRDSRVPLKRGVLLEGTFGVGKTMTANVTAKLAQENGWTFIYLENPEQLAEAIRFAKMYEPAVIFTEDIDRADNEGERNDLMNKILNVIDGVELKSSEVIVVATTNRVEMIAPSLLRPGRLDAVVSFPPPDAEAVERLIRMYSRGTLPLTEDLAGVGRILAGNIPSTVREVVERSKLAAIWRLRKQGVTDASELTLTASDLEIAAHGMLAHLELLKPEEEDDRTDLVYAADVLAEAIVEAAGKPNGAIAGAVATHVN